MVSRDYTGDELLKTVTQAGVTKIIASGIDTDFIRIEVYHNKPKNNPIVSEVSRQYWYGDVVEQFGLTADNTGFRPVEVDELNKDIGRIVYEMAGVLIEHREKQVEEEV